MEDERDEHIDFGHAVLKLLELHQRVHVQLDRAAFHALQQQIELVRIMALNAILPLTVLPFPGGVQ